MATVGIEGVKHCQFDNENIPKYPHLRCGGIFSDNAITNFLLILTVKEF